jgi:hypothetical protein
MYMQHVPFLSVIFPLAVMYFLQEQERSGSFGLVVSHYCGTD